MLVTNHHAPILFKLVKGSLIYKGNGTHLSDLYHCHSFIQGYQPGMVTGTTSDKSLI